jgi:two-component system, LytTR family, sensor kinase
MLEMKARCEKCAAALRVQGEAYICSYECTFCPECALSSHLVCPHCGGELFSRPPRRITSANSESSGVDIRAITRPWLIWVASFAIWIFIAIARGVSLYQFDRIFDPQASLRGEITFPLINYLIYAFLTPIIFYVGLRYPVQRSAWKLRTTLYLTGSLAFTAVHIVARALVYPVIETTTGQPVPVGWSLLRNLFFYNVATDILFVYLPIVVMVHALWYYRRFSERDIRASQLEGHLAKAHLQALKSQLQPHFLFNTLHSISALMLTDVYSADKMISRLSELLRMALDNDGGQLTTLERELEFVSGYLEIEKIRFEDRLKVIFEIEPETVDAQVPHFLLQPLVENAVRHGVSRLSSGGEIRIAASHDSDYLHLLVSDNGPGLTDSTGGPGGNGLGLGTTRERLRTLYGSDQSLEVRDGVEGGVEVLVKIPFAFTHVQPDGEVPSVGITDELSERTHHHSDNPHRHR